MDGQIMRDLLRRMNLREYPPRFRCEVVDLTRCKKFFAGPKILRYKLILGEEIISRNVIIPSLNGKRSETKICTYYTILQWLLVCKNTYCMQNFYITVCLASQIAFSMMCLHGHPQNY